ncbi:MAG: hypothetical protein IPK46_15495 [Saprospiraceae bacterium]|nr:hypothetical protein [Saprospiraceae bacterium]
MCVVIVLCQDTRGNINLDTWLETIIFWLTQAQLCVLFQKSKATVSKHIKNVFEEGELEEKATVRKFRTVQTEGSREVERELDYFNLDVIEIIELITAIIKSTRARIPH